MKLMFVLMIRMKMYHYTAMFQPIQKMNEAKCLPGGREGFACGEPLQRLRRGEEGVVSAPFLLGIG